MPIPIEHLRARKTSRKKQPASSPSHPLQMKAIKISRSGPCTHPYMTSKQQVFAMASRETKTEDFFFFERKKSKALSTPTLAGLKPLSVKSFHVTCMILKVEQESLTFCSTEVSWLIVHSLDRRFLQRSCTHDGTCKVAHKRTSGIASQTRPNF